MTLTAWSYSAGLRCHKRYWHEHDLAAIVSDEVSEDGYGWRAFSPEMSPKWVRDGFGATVDDAMEQADTALRGRYGLPAARSDGRVVENDILQGGSDVIICPCDGYCATHCLYGDTCRDDELCRRCDAAGEKK